MKKKEKKLIKETIENEDYLETNTQIVYNRLIYNPLVRVAGLTILLIFSIIYNNRIIKLASLTSNAIFGNEKILGYITYYTVLILTILVCLVISASAIFVKKGLVKSTISNLRKTYNVYLIYDLVIFIISSFVCLFFIIMILITPCGISGSSMEPTLSEQDRVLLWNIFYEPEDDDIIVFDSAKYTDKVDSSSRFYIKRIVAKEGDTIKYINGQLVVNDKQIESISLYQYKDVILESIGLDFEMSFVVPNDKVLVLGDNRNVSHDSRAFGFIDESEIIGKVLFRFYPFNKIGNV